MYFLQTAPYQVGDPAFEFIVRPCEDKRVTLESRKFANCFLSVGQNAAESAQERARQFAVRVQVTKYVDPLFLLNIAMI